MAVTKTRREVVGDCKKFKKIIIIEKDDFIMRFEKIDKKLACVKVVKG